MDAYIYIGVHYSQIIMQEAQSFTICHLSAMAARAFFLSCKYIFT